MTLCAPAVTRMSAATGVVPAGLPSMFTAAPDSLTRNERYPVTAPSSLSRPSAVAERCLAYRLAVGLHELAVRVVGPRGVRRS